MQSFYGAAACDAESRAGGSSFYSVAGRPSGFAAYGIEDYASCEGESASLTASGSAAKVGASTIPGLSEAQAAMLRRMDFKTWLCMVDPRGELERYHARIKENYDTVTQVVKSYVSVSPQRQLMFDAQLFKDMDVHIASHKSLFVSWFCSTCGPELLVYEWSSEHTGGTQRTDTSREIPSVSNISSDALRSISFVDWLRTVEGSGGGALQRYVIMLTENYDTVAQIVKSYIFAAHGGVVLDLQFFEDCQVSEAHRPLFLTWFASQCGATLAMERGSAPISLTGCKTEPRTFRDWLLRVDPSGALLQYAGAFEENYDTVAQVIRTYKTDGEPGLDMQFFEDMAVPARHHHLFTDWFRQSS
jgi:hypothetical protein